MKIIKIKIEENFGKNLWKYSLPSQIVFVVVVVASFEMWIKGTDFHKLEDESIANGNENRIESNRIQFEMNWINSVRIATRSIGGDKFAIT